METCNISTDRPENANTVLPNRLFYSTESAAHAPAIPTTMLPVANACPALRLMSLIKKGVTASAQQLPSMSKMEDALLAKDLDTGTVETASHALETKYTEKLLTNASAQVICPTSLTANV